MNKIVLIIMLFISNHLISQITMKEFVQKTEYKDWETEPSYSNTEEDWYFKKDNKRVRISKFSDTFQIEETNTLTPWECFWSYSRKTEILVLKGQSFYNIPTGKWVYYDEMGRIKKEIDYDKSYKFSIKELIEKIKKEYDIDIEGEINSPIVGLETDNEGNKYFSISFDPKGLVNIYGERTYILVDVNTGKTLFKTSYFKRNDGETPPFYRYLEMKKGNTTSLFIEETTQPKELGVPYKQGGYYPAGTYRLYNDRAFTKKEWELYVKTRPWWERLFLS